MIKCKKTVVYLQVNTFITAKIMNGDITLAAPYHWQRVLVCRCTVHYFCRFQCHFAVI